MFVVSLQSPENIYFVYKANHLKMPNPANSSWNVTRKCLHCRIYPCGPVLPKTVHLAGTPSAHIHITMLIQGPGLGNAYPMLHPRCSQTYFKNCFVVCY